MITSGWAWRALSMGAVTSVVLPGARRSAVTICTPRRSAVALAVAKLELPNSLSSAKYAIFLPLSSFTANSIRVAPTERCVPPKAP